MGEPATPSSGCSTNPDQPTAGCECSGAASPVLGPECVCRFDPAEDFIGAVGRKALNTLKVPIVRVPLSDDAADYVISLAAFIMNPTAQRYLRNASSGQPRGRCHRGRCEWPGPSRFPMASSQNTPHGHTPIPLRSTRELIESPTCGGGRYPGEGRGAFDCRASGGLLRDLFDFPANRFRGGRALATERGQGSRGVLR